MTVLLLTALAVPVVGAGTYWFAEWLAASLIGSARASGDRHRGAEAFPANPTRSARPW